MRSLSPSLIARHVVGGLRCFAHHHREEARFFPPILWGPTTNHLVRAQWCVIAGSNRMSHLDKPTILSHSGFGFESLLAKYPDLKDRYLPRIWWPSVIKRGVNTLWPELRKFETVGARPKDASFRCDRCLALAVGSRRSG